MNRSRSYYKYDIQPFLVNSCTCAIRISVILAFIWHLNLGCDLSRPIMAYVLKFDSIVIKFEF